jgi:hypothetical protein
MAGVTGRKPKPLGQAVNRHAPTHDWTEVPNVSYKKGPKLPARRANGRLWPPQARAVWKAWSSMPHCVLWADGDWQFALLTIELVALVYDGDTKYATEVRNRERVLGTTVDYRRDLRIRYVEPKTASSSSGSGVTNIADYRDF